MIKIIRQALTLLLAVSLLASVPTAFAADLHQSPDDISLEQAISAIDGELKTSGTSIEQELLSLKNSISRMLLAPLVMTNIADG